MRKRTFTGPRLAVIGLMVGALSAMNVTAQDSSKATPPSESLATATVSQTSPVQLSPGVPEVLKLVQSKIGDDTIMAFINNSGTTYSLGVSEIIYLREQGASDKVITAMLNQRSKPPVATASVAPAQSPATDVATAPAFDRVWCFACAGLSLLLL